MTDSDVANPTDPSSPAAAAHPERLDHVTFRDRTLAGARFVACDLSDVVVRGSDVARMEVDSPWLFERDGRLVVNGVDVLPFVDAELNRRFPGRELRTAPDADGLRRAWDAVERAWAALLDRAARMPPGTVAASVDGEWSLAQTLRHLVMATDTWLGRAVLEQEHPYHPAGLPNDDHDSAAYEMSVFSEPEPTWPRVLEARADRQERVRAHLTGLAEGQLGARRHNPHAPEHDETVRSCLQTILAEEWEHLRYATRDLDALATDSSA